MSHTKFSAIGLLIFAAFIGCDSDGDPPGDTPPNAGGGGSLESGGANAMMSGGSTSSGGTGSGAGSSVSEAGGSGSGSGGSESDSGGSAGSGSTGSGSGSGGESDNGTGGSDNPIGGSGGEAAGTGGGNTGGTIGTNGCTPPGPTVYPNLFVSILGHTQEESDAKVEEAWDQLFNPSDSDTIYYDGPGSDESYIKDIASNDVRTEGMSYGMMTAVQLDHQTEFDRLWAWVLNHMAQGTGEIAWSVSTSGQKNSTGAAPDGEEYFATALIFAEKRWGDTGRFDYAAEAQWVLDLMRTEYFNEEYHIIQFVKNSGNTDASYIMPAFYEVWACFDTENAEFWKSAVTAGREFFQAAADQNGVMGDRQSFSGQTQQGAGSDAKRCVMNVMMDHNFFNADPWQVDTYAPAFGSYMSSRQNGAAEISCNALLGFGLPESDGEIFVETLWDARIPTGQYRYYDGTLYMLGLLHVSGVFKLWY